MLGKKFKTYKKTREIVDENGIGTGKFESVPMWIYELFGTKKELKEYEEVQKANGHNFHKHPVSGRPLFFSPSFQGATCEVAISHNPETDEKRAYVDDSAQLEKVDVINRVGGKLGDELAKLGAKDLYGQLFGKSESSTGGSSSEEGEGTEVDPSEADLKQP